MAGKDGLEGLFGRGLDEFDPKHEWIPTGKTTFGGFMESKGFKAVALTGLAIAAGLVIKNMLASSTGIMGEGVDVGIMGVLGYIANKVTGGAIGNIWENLTADSHAKGAPTGNGFVPPLATANAGGPVDQ